MKILMLSPVFPLPRDTGGKVRILQIARGLARHHQVTFAAPVTDMEHRKAAWDALGCNAVLVQARNRRWVSGLRACLSSQPYHVALFEPELVHAIRSLLERECFSLIYVHFLRAFPYVPPAGRIPVVLDQQNVDREYWLRKARTPVRSPLVTAFALTNWCKTIRYETSILPRIAAYVSVSERDRCIAMSYARPPVERFLVAPNGVDLEHFLPRHHDVQEAEGHITLGFLGALDLRLNRDAALLVCRKVLPAVRSLLPSGNASLLLIGRNPPACLRRLASRDPHIELTGRVQDVVPHLKRVDILALPLKEGAGTKLRTLEGMAVALPIVGFPLAFQGIDGVVDGLNARIVGDVDAMCSAIVDLARRPRLRRQLGCEARRLVESCYGWDRVTGALAEQLESVRAGLVV